MSIASLAMNLTLAVLLLAALAMGMRLNKRLKALRDSQDGFADAVGELNRAAARAEQGLADLRAATDEATDLLADRIDKGRQLAMKLERLIEHANVPQRQAQSQPAEDPMAERRLGALLAAAREARPERVMPPLRAGADRNGADRSALQALIEREQRRVAGDALPNPSYERPYRARRLTDDDLFDDQPLSLDRAPLDRAPLDRAQGARR